MNRNFLGVVNDDKVIVKIMLVASVLVILVSAFFGWLMTSYGLILTRILPTEALMSQKALSYVLAFAIHAALAILYITLSMSFGRKRLTSSLSLLIPFLGLLTITVYFSFLSISYEAKGTATFDKLFSDIKSLDKKITHADHHITSAFLTQIEALEKLARDSDRGLDETRIAACGPICKKHLNRRSEFLSRFSLLAQELPGSNLGVDKDINECWRDVEARYERFFKKVVPFDEFVKETNLSPVSWIELKDQFSKVQENFGRKDILDKISVVMNRANSFLTSLISGEKKDKDTTFFLFLILAALPESINFTVMIALITLNRPLQMPTKELEQTLEEEKKRFKLEREYITTRNLHHLFRRAHSKIFRNYVGSSE